MIDPNIDARQGDAVGSLVGNLGNGAIINCYAQGGSVSGDEGVGGLAGNNRETMTNCYSSASVTGTIFIGGLVGDNQGGSITNCYSST